MLERVNPQEEPSVLLEQLKEEICVGGERHKSKSCENLPT